MAVCKVIALCGSTKFKEVFIEVARELTLLGHVVLLPTIFKDADGITLTEKELTTVRKMHLKMIDIADEILVINVNNYIGNDTYGEIAYAGSKGMRINYLVRPD